MELGDLENYFTYYNSLIHDYHFDNWMFLVESSIEHSEMFFDDNSKMDSIIEWSEQALSLENNYFTNFGLSYTYYLGDRNEKALVYARKALELCEDPPVCEDLTSFIREIEGE